jgi:hypothetical protein
VEGRVTSRRWIAGARELPFGVNAVLPRRCAGARPRTTAKLSRLGASKQSSEQTSFSLARTCSLVSSLLSLSTFSRAFQSNVGIAVFLQASGRNCAPWISWLLLMLSLLAVVVALQLMSVGTCGR